MSRTQPAHWIPDSLSKRIPYTDTLKYDPYEISLGYGHQEISHLLDILLDALSPKASKIKSLRLLCDVLPGRQSEAIQHNAFNVLKPFLNQPPNGLLLHSLIALNILVDSKDHSTALVPEIPKIVEIVAPEIEVPLRLAAASLLRHIAEFVGPVPEFTDGKAHYLLVAAASAKDSSKEFLVEMFYLLSRLTNIQKVRVPIISSTALMSILCKSVEDPVLRSSAILLACNIAMDKSHHGKTALLEAGFLDVLNPLLQSPEIAVRMSALSLISLLAVPKDGKELLSTMPDTADMLLKISQNDPDLYCRRAATKCRIFIAEIPFGKVIVGDVVDPSVPIPKPLSELPKKEEKTDDAKPNSSKETEEKKNETIPRPVLQAEAEGLVFLANAAYWRATGNFLSVKHSLHDGVYLIDENEPNLKPEFVKELEDEVRNQIQQAVPIEFLKMPNEQLMKKFVEMGRKDKIGVLKTMNSALIPCIKSGEYIDYVINKVSDDIPPNKVFEFHCYGNGFILRTPTITSQTKLIEWADPEAQMQMFKEYTDWANLIGVKTVQQLNDHIFKRDFEEIKWTAEGLHKKKLALIARTLVSNFPQKKIVTIAGPSSSNKTTFAKLLQIHLRVLGYNSLVIEMDDYAQNREETPYGPDGLRDYEAITAFNLKVFSERVHKLLNGEAIPRRKFDFKTGLGYDIESETQTLPDKTFAIFEGIHGLNPELLQVIGEELVTPIYVAPLTPLSIDSNHRFPTTDLRLIRRIIRDHKYRGTSARSTIMRWTSVRVGEEKNIFPYQKNAQMFFNSSLIYELPVLAIFGRALLAEATVPEEGEDPNDEKVKLITEEARRILTLLNMFYPIPVEEVPHISCLREFIGGSDLKY